jgi:hypothetical protein
MKGMTRITWINLLIGIWLIGSPFVFGYTMGGGSDAVINDVVVGILLVICSWWLLAVTGRPSVSRPTSVGLSGFEALCGAWLIAAPFVMHSEMASHIQTSYLMLGAAVLVVGAVETWVVARLPMRQTEAR